MRFLTLTNLGSDTRHCTPQNKSSTPIYLPAEPMPWYIKKEDGTPYVIPSNNIINLRKIGKQCRGDINLIKRQLRELGIKPRDWWECTKVELVDLDDHTKNNVTSPIVTRESDRKEKSKQVIASEIENGDEYSSNRWQKDDGTKENSYLRYYPMAIDNQLMAALATKIAIIELSSIATIKRRVKSSKDGHQENNRVDWMYASVPFKLKQLKQAG